jgi:hypothetical protein
VVRDSTPESFIEAGLATFGVEADELERAVMLGAWEVYRPALELLLSADLSEVEPERDPDLSRPPAR